MGTEGNEQSNRFRGSAFFETDFALRKNQRITERTNLQFRFEFLNLFKNPNLTRVASNLPDSTFGMATGQYNPRWVQFGLNLIF